VLPSEVHLARLAEPAARERLARLGLAWGERERQVCLAVGFRRARPEAPPLAGLLGGASSGKSSLFNTLLGEERSRVSAHAHETRGPLAAVPRAWAPRVRAWLAAGELLTDLKPEEGVGGAPSAGSPGQLVLFEHDRPELAGVVLLDLPDVTSQRALEEGSLAWRLLPWLDLLVVTLDEERWFDAEVFAGSAAAARELGARAFAVFNRTEGGEPLGPGELARLQEHAIRQGAEAACLGEYRPGRGYRPLDPELRWRVQSWLAAAAAQPRQARLEAHLRRHCAGLVRQNVERADRFEDLARRVRLEVDSLERETSLSADLLTPEERRRLGLGRQLLPLYDLVSWLRSALGREAAAEVDFEKGEEALSELLRANLELRFRSGAERIEALWAAHPYLAGADPDPADAPASGPLAPDPSFRGRWSPPELDPRDWARRIRSQIEAWKREADRRSRRGDLAALGLATPLILADLLLLGGSGLTLGWAGAWLAGLFGGKALGGAARQSPAFRDYQASVRAYQRLVREALSEQAERNLEALPRRHLPAGDPLFQSILHWSGPARPAGAGG
jgi:hypothetical protein